MTTSAAVLAAEGDVNPMSILIPADYDIIWSAVVLLVIAVAFYKFVLPKMNSVLDERSAKIEGGIDKAERVQAEADELRGKSEAELDAAHSEADKIRHEARAEGASLVAEAREKAQSEADRIVAAAKAQIEAERSSAVGQLRSEVGGLASELAAKIVGESLTDDARSSRVIDRFLDDLEQSDSVASSPAPTVSQES